MFYLDIFNIMCDFYYFVNGEYLVFKGRKLYFLSNIYGGLSCY